MILIKSYALSHKDQDQEQQQQHQQQQEVGCLLEYMFDFKS